MIGRRVIGAIAAAATVAGVVILTDRTDSPAGALSILVDRFSPSADANPGDGTCADSSGQCSLRAAIEEVNALGGAHSIVLPAGSHALGGAIEITAELTIDELGPDPAVIDLDGQGGFTVELGALTIDGVDVENGLTELEGGSAIRAVDSTVVVNSATFRNNNSDGDGGAIFSARSELSLLNATFVDNSAINGGAISVIAGRTLVTGSRFLSNGASSSGGAISATSAEAFVVEAGSSRSEFESNTAIGRGGAIHVTGESATGDRYEIGSVDFRGNTAGNEGGALFVGPNAGANEPLLLSDCTFEENVGVVGGAIAIDLASVEVRSCSFERNRALGGAGGAIGSGGSLEVVDSTFDQNTANGNGGAIGANGPLVVDQSDFTANEATEFGGAMSTSGPVAPVISDTSVVGNLAGEDVGGIWHVGPPIDETSITSSQNEPDGPAVVVGAELVADIGPGGGSGGGPGSGSGGGSGTGSGDGSDGGSDDGSDGGTGPDPDPPAVGGVTPVSPGRLVDTRPGQTTVDGQLAGVGVVEAGSSLRVPVHSRGGVPDSATAVVVNTVAVAPSGPGFLTLYPCDEDRPSTSSVNYGSRPVDVNNALVKLSADGALCVFARTTTHVVLDVTAYSEGSEALAPKRLAESRRGQSTDDGQQAGFGRVGAESTTTIEVAGRGGVPADAAAVAVNVTAVRPSGPGFLTLFPCDEDRPNASNLNYGPGDVRPNAAVVALSGEGTLCVFSKAETDLIVDVTASFVTDPSFTPLNPARLLETRRGNATVDGQSAGGGRLVAGSVTKVQVAGRGGVPADASTAAVNLAAIRPSGPGFVTLYPCDESQPNASSMNYVPGDVIANSGVVKLAADGSVCVFTKAEIDLVMDVNAAWTS